MHLEVYKTLETTIWDVLKIVFYLVINNNKYSSHVVNNVIFSFNGLGCLYNTRDEDLGGFNI